MDDGEEPLDIGESDDRSEASNDDFLGVSIDGLLGLSKEGRLGLSNESRLGLAAVGLRVSIEGFLGVGDGLTRLGVKGSWDVDEELKPRRFGVDGPPIRLEEGWTGVDARGVGELGGLWSGRCPLLEAAIRFVEAELSWWRERGIGVGVSGGLGGTCERLGGVCGERQAVRFVKGRDAEEVLVFKGGGFGLVREEASFGIALTLPRDGSRLDMRGLGPLISFVVGWALGGRDRGGETSAELGDDDETGTADRDFGLGKAWEDKCNAGEDIVAWRMEGDKKLTKAFEGDFSETFLFLLASFVLLTGGGSGDGGVGVTDSRPDRLKVTLDSKRFSILLCPFSFVTSSARVFSFSFPFFPLATFANSSITGEVGLTLEDRVAFRKLCSIDDFILWKGFAGGSGCAEEEMLDVEDWPEQPAEEAGCGPLALVRWWGRWVVVVIWNGNTFAVEATAAAMSDWHMQRIWGERQETIGSKAVNKRWPSNQLRKCGSRKDVLEEGKVSIRLPGFCDAVDVQRRSPPKPARNGRKMNTPVRNKQCYSPAVSKINCRESKRVGEVYNLKSLVALKIYKTSVGRPNKQQVSL
jgi:hypothetical protein